VVGGDEPERRKRAGEERRAATGHDGMQAEAIFIDQAEPAQASRQVGSGNRDLPGNERLEIPYRSLDAGREERGFRADRWR
jgi:hypothetical protein